jgi:Domain of unknown function (DUF927)
MAPSPLDVLDWILPTKGPYYAAAPWVPPGKTKASLPSRAYATLASLRDALAQASGGDKDSYFALASFIHATVLKPGFGGKPAKQRTDRTNTNVKALRSLFVDCDFGPRKGYATADDVENAVYDIVDKGVLPPPSVVVFTGHGLHFYWCFEDDLTPDDWQPYADGLKNLLALENLTFDAGVTIDRSRVLRTPGSINWKDPANPVDSFVLTVTKQYTPADLAFLLPLAGSTPVGAARKHVPSGTTIAMPDGPVSSVFAAAAIDDTAGLTANVQGIAREYYMGRIVPHCAQLAEMEKTGGANCAEPAWKAMLLLAARCSDGDTYAHALSDQHNGYSAVETSAKLEQQRATLANGTAGPTHCKGFNAARPGICESCPVWARAQRGETAIPLKLGEDIPAYPRGYARSASSDMVRVRRTEEGETLEDLVLVGWIDNMVLVHTTDGNELHFVHNTPHGGTEIKLQMQSVVSDGGAARYLTSRGLVAPTPRGYKLMSEMFMSFQEHLTRNTKAFLAPPSAGYVSTPKGEGFQLGARLITANGVETASSFGGEGTRHMFEPVGSMEKQRAALDLIAAGPIEQQVLLAAAFAGVLAKPVNFRGAILSVLSRGSGYGKTTASRVALSMFGNPEKLMFQLTDTEMSILRRIGEQPNLTAYWDEVRSFGDPRAFIKQMQMLFQLAQGRERSRLDAKLTTHGGKSWNTILTVLTNEHLLRHVGGSDNPAEPIFARFFELELTKTVPTTPSHSRVLNAVEENYGHFAEPFLTYVLQNKAALVDRVQKRSAVYAAIEEGRFNTGRFRFWRDLVALLVTGAEAGAAAGVVALDAKAMEVLLLTTMKKNARLQAAQVDDARSDVSELQDYLARNVTGWYVHSDIRKMGVHPSPRTGCICEINLDTGTVLVNVAAYRTLQRKAGNTPYIRPGAGVEELRVFADQSLFMQPKALVVRVPLAKLGIAETAEAMLLNAPEGMGVERDGKILSTWG